MTNPKIRQADGPKSPERMALLARKMAQAADGRMAMAEYERDQQATLDRTARLRAQRLAQPKPPESVKAVKKTVKKTVKKAARG